MFLLNGSPLPVGRAFTHEGVQYPANWLQLATSEEKSAIGITEQADPVRADDRFYWNGDINTPMMMDDRAEVDADGNPIYVKVLDKSDPDPMNWTMVDSEEQLVTKGLKTNWTETVKNTAGSLLASTDWYVSRKSEKDIAIPADVVTKRDAIRTECDRLETAIAACENVEALIAVINNQNWGE